MSLAFFGIVVHGLALLGDPTAAMQALQALLDIRGFPRLSATVLKLSEPTAEYLLKIANSGGFNRVTQLMTQYGKNLARLDKIVDGIKAAAPAAAPSAGGAGPFMRFLGSAEFASITGLIGIAYESAQIAQASSDATAAMDDAQRTGRLTDGAVQKAFNELPSDIQHSVQSIKDAQNLISGYTTMKFNTQKLMAKADPQLRVEYQNLSDRAAAKIQALSKLLDTMRATGYEGFPNRTGKKSPQQNKAAKFAQQSAMQLAVQDAKNKAAQAASALSMAQVSAQSAATIAQLAAQSDAANKTLYNLVAKFDAMTTSSGSYHQGPASNPYTNPGLGPNAGPQMPDIPAATPPPPQDQPPPLKCGTDIFCGPDHPECCDIHPIGSFGELGRIRAMYPRRKSRLSGLGRVQRRPQLTMRDDGKKPKKGTNPYYDPPPIFPITAATTTTGAGLAFKVLVDYYAALIKPGLISEAHDTASGETVGAAIKTLTPDEQQAMVYVKDFVDRALPLAKFLNGKTGDSGSLNSAEQNQSDAEMSKIITGFIAAYNGIQQSQAGIANYNLEPDWKIGAYYDSIAGMAKALKSKIGRETDKKIKGVFDSLFGPKKQGSIRQPPRFPTSHNPFDVAIAAAGNMHAPGLVTTPVSPSGFVASTAPQLAPVGGGFIDEPIEQDTPQPTQAPVWSGAVAGFGELFGAW